MEQIEETKKIYKIIKSLKIPGWISGWPVLSLVVVVLLLHYGPVGADAQAQKKIYGEESSNKHCFDIGAGWTVQLLMPVCYHSVASCRFFLGVVLSVTLHFCNDDPCFSLPCIDVRPRVLVVAC